MSTGVFACSNKAGALVCSNKAGLMLCVPSCSNGQVIAYGGVLAGSDISGLTLTTAATIGAIISVPCTIGLTSIGTLAWNTGALIAGPLTAGGQFAAGGTITATITAGLPLGVVFSGTFGGPVTLTLVTTADGHHDYTTTGEAEGTDDDGDTGYGLLQHIGIPDVYPLTPGSSQYPFKRLNVLSFDTDLSGEEVTIWAVDGDYSAALSGAVLGATTKASIIGIMGIDEYPLAGGMNNNLGSVSLTTAGSFAAGGSVTITTNGTGCTKSEVLFSGTFDGIFPVTWTLITLPNGNHRYTLVGSFTGAYRGFATVHGLLSCITKMLPDKAYFDGSIDVVSTEVLWWCNSAFDPAPTGWGSGRFDGDGGDLGVSPDRPALPSASRLCPRCNAPLRCGCRESCAKCGYFPGCSD